MRGNQYDVVVIGAGPAGCAAAYFLTSAGLHVALVDKADFPRDKPCGDGLTPRALAKLQQIGVLSEVVKHAHCCGSVTVRHSEETSFRLDLAQLEAAHRKVFVLPRFKLDDLLRAHAVAAGAQFVAKARVNAVSRGAGRGCSVRIADGRSLQSSLVILATGANWQLQRSLGLHKAMPPLNVAARVYFENVEGLDDSLVLFFDGLELPGYGWVFPTGDRTANVGCGLFIDTPRPQVLQLRKLIAENPYLRRILRNARQVGPIKAYPLRTDFSPAHSGRDHVLVTGEALGLVNPITGEGIDYALESAELAAEAIVANWKGGLAAIQRRYRAALARHFRYRFILSRIVQRVYFRDGVFEGLMARAQRKVRLRQAIVDTCFGYANPAKLFSPAILWDMFGPSYSLSK